MSVHVVVRFLDGNKALEVDLTPKSSVADLKEVVASRWSIPERCQKLILGNSPLSDEEVVVEQCYQLVISLDAVCRSLESDDWLDRKEALQALGLLGLKAGDVAVSWATALLEDGNDNVRRTAIWALGRVTAKGDPGALEAVAARLSHERGDVRYSAAQALVEVAPHGDRCALAKLGPCFKDADWTVRYAAVLALRRLAEIGDPVTIAGLDRFLAGEAVEMVGRAAARTRDLLTGEAE
mmetsp:Transcript_104812/g.291906  ORF Transcript_104812/g.291906 Transcript_104812/m.291906 type:complete len:238 (+) Transcript_104812:90-803(+)